MEWREDGLLLSVRPHGESSAIIDVFTQSHGRHAGVVRGGASRRMAPLLQPGAQLALVWRARLADQIGVFQAEPVASRAGVLEDPLALAGLTAVCALLQVSLPERAPHPQLYRQSLMILDAMAQGRDWVADYLRWEMLLLEEIGFGLDLSSCAVTGLRDDLAFVSPKTGRAVSRGGAGDWAPRLLPLPPALLGQGPATGIEVAQGLALTGFFLARGLGASGRSLPLPEARVRLLARLERSALPP